MQGDLWHNRLNELFGFQATGRKLARGARIYEFARSNLQEPLDIFKVILALSTLLPDDRHFPGDAQPTKWNLLHRFLLEHEKVGAFLQDLCQRPLAQHGAYADRLMREAYAEYRTVEDEAAETVEAADAEADV